MADNNTDMMRMQQEAIRRVRSMQARAQRTVHSDTPPPAEAPAPAAAAPVRRRLHRAQKAPVPSAFSRLLTGDSEQMLLLVLLLILMEERTDPALILALLYVIL